MYTISSVWLLFSSRSMSQYHYFNNCYAYLHATIYGNYFNICKVPRFFICSFQYYRSSKILSQCTFTDCYQEQCAPEATDANLAACT